MLNNKRKSILVSSFMTSPITPLLRNLFDSQKERYNKPLIEDGKATEDIFILDTLGSGFVKKGELIEQIKILFPDQLVTINKNAKCNCGSGKKRKNCCLSAFKGK